MKEIRCPIVWYPQSSFMGIVAADGATLGVTIVGNVGDWQVSAIETSATLKEGIDGVLNNHSHEFLGGFKDFERARRVGTLYAKKWFEEKHRAKKCACKPIGKKKR